MGSTSNECGVSYQIWRIAKQIRTSDSPSAEGACYIWVQASYLFSAEVFQGTHHLSSLPWQSICLSFVLAPTLPVAMMVAQEEQPFGNDGHVLHVGHHKSRQTFYRCQYECVACLVYPARFFFASAHSPVLQTVSSSERVVLFFGATTAHWGLLPLLQRHLAIAAVALGLPDEG